MPTSTSASAMRDASFGPEVEEWVQGLCDRWYTPGLGLSVVTKAEDGTLKEHVSTYGRRNAEGDSFAADSLFTIASCSKLFTAVAVGLLIEDGVMLSNGVKLTWETKLKDILPEWKLSDEYASEHTDLIDLLSMRTGLPGHDRAMTSQTPEDIVRLLRHLPLSAEIRQVRQYSNISYIVASHVVSTLSGVPFPDFVKMRIFDRLGMEDTTYDAIQVTQSGRRVQGFVQVGLDERKAEDAWSARGPSENDGTPAGWLGTSTSYEWSLGAEHVHNAGAGGIWTTANDVLKWLKELISPTMIPSAVFSAVTSAHSLPYASPVNPETGFFTYGLGTYVHSYRSHKALYHAGGLPGQYSYQLTLPERGFGVLVMSNDDTYSGGINKIVAYTVMDVLLGLKLAEGDWEKRMFDNWWWSPSAHASVQAPPSDEEIAGTYINPGYPALRVQPLAEHDILRQHLAAIQARTSSTLRFDGPVYYAPSPSVFVEDVIFTHHDGRVFNWVATKLHPAYGSNGKLTGEKVVPFVDGVGQCVFGGDGLGMSGDWWVSGGKKKRGVEEGTSKGHFEVWFEKEQSLIIT